MVHQPPPVQGHSPSSPRSPRPSHRPQPSPARGVSPPRVPPTTPRIATASGTVPGSSSSPAPGDHAPSPPPAPAAQHSLPIAVPGPTGLKDLPTVPRYASIWSRFQRRCKWVVRGWWAWELLSATLSLVATVALIVMLWKIDGGPQQSWQIGQTQLTLNAIVAVISTVMRAGLLLAVAGALNQSSWNWFASKRTHPQEANPGRPLDDFETFSDAAANTFYSIKLVYKTRGRRLASLGATVIILTLFFDAFVQQVLNVDLSFNKAILAGGALKSENMLPRAEKYLWQLLVTPSHTLGPTPPPPMNITGAIANSVTNTNISLPGAVCPTGNCTWPLTPTLAICSACFDVKQQLVTNSSQGNVSYSFVWDPTEFADVGENSTLSFQSDLTDEPTNTDVYLVQAAGTTGGPDSGEAVIAQLIAMGISNSSYGQFNGDYAPGFALSEKLLDPLITAYSCRFSFCLKAYSASSTSGILDQSSIPMTWKQTQKLGDEGVDFDSEIHFFSEAPPDLHIANASMYQIGEDSLRSMGKAFHSVIFGTASYSNNYEQIMSNGVDGDATNIMQYTQAFFSASDSLENMTALATGMANSLTSFLRENLRAPPDPELAPTVLELALIVDVRWVWLIYPLAVLAAGHFFFVATIWHTHRLQVLPWKGHRTPLLLAETDPTVRRLASGGLDRRTGLEDRVGRIHVRLEFDGRDSVAFRRVTA